MCLLMLLGWDVLYIILCSKKKEASSEDCHLFPIGFMGLVYLPTFTMKKILIHVLLGKYISPMDPIGFWCVIWCRIYLDVSQLTPCKAVWKRKTSPPTHDFCGCSILLFRLQCPKTKTEDAIQGGPRIQL